MNVKKQEAKLLKTMIKADDCVDRNTAQKLIRKADKILAKLEKQSYLLTMDTTVVLSLFSGFSVGCIAAALVLQ